MIPSEFIGVWNFYSEVAAEGGRKALQEADGGNSYSEYLKHYNKTEDNASIGKFDFQDLIFEHVPFIRDPGRMLPERDIVVVENGDGGTGTYRNNYMILDSEAQRTHWGNDGRASAMYGYHGNDAMIGNHFDNALYGADRAHLYEGSYATRPDNDFLVGLGGNDKLYGGGGNDVLHGGEDDDLLHGGDGHDILFGAQNEDVLIGGNGNDILIGGIGSDVMHGGTGDDIFAMGYNLLEHFDKDVIGDFGNGYDAVIFNKPLSELGIAVEEDSDNGIISFKSEVTRQVVLEAHVDGAYVGLYDDGIRVLGDVGEVPGLHGMFDFRGSDQSAGDLLVDAAVQDFLG